MQYLSNTFKLIVFFLIISFSTSATFALLFTQSSHVNFYKFLLLGAIAGPIFSLIFVRQKGAYSGCVLLIFMSEIALICSSLYNDYYAANILSHCFLGSSLTSTLFLCPIITYYLRGQINFIKALPSMLLTVFFGLLLANPLFLLPKELLCSNTFVLSTISLLVASFFTVFSAWKHRLVLLK